MKIILIGFMGAGKSAVAEQLAEKLHLVYVEMDAVVLKQSGEESINAIFAKKGETAFRELEISVAKQLSTTEDVVVATGGGVVMNKINIDYLREKDGVVIFLDTSFDTIIKRLEGDTTRPLMKDREKAKKLYNWRENLYKTYADIVISTENKSIDAISKEITERTEKKL